MKYRIYLEDKNRTVHDFKEVRDFRFVDPDMLFIDIDDDNAYYFPHHNISFFRARRINEEKPVYGG